MITTTSKLGKVEELANRGIVMYPQTKAIEAFEVFEKDKDTTEICIIDEENNFCGILTRDATLNAFSGMYGYVLNKKHKATEIMEKNPLVVEADCSVENVSKQAMERKTSQIYDAVVVVKGGKYFGVITIK